MSKLVITKDLVTTVDTGLDWYGFITPPQKEYTAAHILGCRGIPTFVPTETRWRSTNRYTKSRLQKEEQAFPVFPRYVFSGFPAGTEPPWYWLGNFPLIVGVVGKKQRPHPADRKEFARFAPIYANGLLRAPREHRHMVTGEEFTAGSEAFVKQGPLRDHRVRVVELNDASAKVLIKLFGTERELDLPLATMARVA